MFDLLSIDTWNKRTGSSYVIIQSIPKMLVYVYHHVYGALHINRESLSKIFNILEKKLPCDANQYEYDLLYRMRSITGWIDSLGRNCFDSFNYLFNSYQQWDWIKYIFNSESEFKETITTYQLTIHLLNFFYSITNKIDNNIPPAFVISDKQKRYAQNWVMKNSIFFKNYLQNKKISDLTVAECWQQWQKGFGGLINLVLIVTIYQTISWKIYYCDCIKVRVGLLLYTCNVKFQSTSDVYG